jgi:hypothetical protein
VWLQLKGIQRRATTLRGLHLVQPVELRGDQVKLVVPHPDGSETEVSEIR